jgi:uncharacterized membrane protein YdjX (TVP38/TMEM64 family)
MNKNKIIVFLLLLTLTFCFYYFDFHKGLSLDTIKNNKELIIAFVEANRLKSIIYFALFYIISTALLIPGASILSLTSGFLFGWRLGGLISIASATLGAVISFLVTRYLLGSYLQSKYATQLQQFNKELNENGIYYLLTIRFIPLFPFFLINLLCGLTVTSLKLFALTTFIGIIPGGFVYAFAGEQLSKLNSLQDLLSWKLIAALMMLGCISLAPTIIKKLKRKKS